MFVFTCSFLATSLHGHSDLESSCKSKNLKANISSGNQADSEGGVQGRV